MTSSEITPDTPKSLVLTTDAKRRLARKFGEGFPLPTEQDGAKWRRWIESQRKLQSGVIRDKRLHWTRHRHLRFGHQWISTRDGRTWREPQADANDVRPVLNIIGPALDFRLGILSEQKPGFRHVPLTAGVSGRESAEAQQAVAEYYFHLLRAWNTFLDAEFHAQTDGAAFIHVYADMNAGPTRQDIELVPPSDQRYQGLIAQGYQVNEQSLVELPYSDEGVVAPPGSEARLLFEGEIANRVLLAHEVLFDPEARSVNGPVDRARWALARRMRSVEQARLETGRADIEAETPINSQNDSMDLPMDRAMGWQRGLPPFPTRRQRTLDGVPEYLLWIAPDQHEPGLEQGLWLRLIGDTIVERGDELPGGVIPLARGTVGSLDADIYPRAQMVDWLIRKLEDKTGWNDIARGQLTGGQGASAQDISGRAVLATRELFERAFGPVVRAAAEGATEWATIVIRYAQWLYDTPRLIPAVGGRGDLAKRVDAALLGDKPMVYVEPETMMPLPRALRQQLLEEQFDKGRISLAEYKQRSVYSDIQNVHMGDADQWERAQYINTQIEEQWEQLAALDPVRERYSPSVPGAIPILWQDVQSVAPAAPLAGAVGQAALAPAQYRTVHKQALLEIILNDRRPWGMRHIALERWGIYDQLERAMNDPTGQTPIPMETTGIPADRAVMMQPTPLGGVAPPPAAPPGQAPGGEGEPVPGTLSSPAPTNAPFVTEAQQIPAPTLSPGERAAMGEQQQL